ncbi:MAG: PEP/pyruvate-binding domain-containing protein [Solirubrobacterales bacterium]|nr:PEP/pyruvate-binding domain-containing protein [Solirubrobacterales bacterium]
MAEVTAGGHTRDLSELRATDAGGFGGKSASLGELVAAGIPVPPGFALGASAFIEFTGSTGIETTIAGAISRVSSSDVATVADASRAIEQAIRAAPVPDAIRDELAQRHEVLAASAGEAEPPLAVRSSALGEDSEEGTYAGQQETFLWLRGVEEVCEAVRECWASLYSTRAISYRASRPPSHHGDPAMGVTIQLMVDAESSGVMFTCNPVSGDPSMIAINASWGLGLAVVGGEVTPDDYLLSKVTGEVVRQTVSSKQIEYVPGADGRGTVCVDVPPDRSDRPCLREQQLAALLEIGKRIERHFGSHQDVEWAIARGQPLPSGLLVLQARPVTGLPERTGKPPASAMSLVMSTFGAGSGARSGSGSGAGSGAGDAEAGS